MKVGFIGLGAMGRHMARNLQESGNNLTVHDLRREAATHILESGAEWADTPKEVAQKSEVIFTSLPGPIDVESVVLGPEGIAEGATKGQIYLDLSTNSPTVTRRLHQEMADRGVAMLDVREWWGGWGRRRHALNARRRRSSSLPPDASITAPVRR